MSISLVLLVAYRHLPFATCSIFHHIQTSCLRWVGKWNLCFSFPASSLSLSSKLSRYYLSCLIDGKIRGGLAWFQTPTFHFRIFLMLTWEFNQICFISLENTQQGLLPSKHINIKLQVPGTVQYWLRYECPKVAHYFPPPLGEGTDRQTELKIILQHSIPRVYTPP